MENKKYIIYGAGKQGQAYLDFLKQKNLDSVIIGFCDKRYDVIKQILGKAVFSYEEAKEQDVQFIVAVGDEKAKNEIIQMFEADDVRYCSMDAYANAAGIDRVKFNREFCAVFHIDNMDEYFNSAESDSAIKLFWDNTSEFKKLFVKLDKKNVIELACGRGRHVQQYLCNAGRITLVDILSKNIEFCKERFKGQGNITYYQNNGYNLKDLESSIYTSLFAYDAMVHFEMMDIYEYLKDIYRVLISGGRVLLHHSNHDADYRAAFHNTPHGRSFMSKSIFAYLAYRAGFEVLEQKVIDWEGYTGLDCITLLQKPIESESAR